MKSTASYSVLARSALPVLVHVSRVLGLLLGATLAGSAIAGPGFGARLDGLQRALTEHASGFVEDPAKHARLAWLYIDGDAQADAIVVVKKEASDCAVHFAAATAQCMGYVFRSLDGARFVPIAAFPYAGQIIYLGPRGARPRALFHTDRNVANPVYDRYTLADGRYALDSQGLATAVVREQAALALSDRSMDRLADHRYSIDNFPENASAALAPARVHLDGVNSSYFTRGLLSPAAARRVFAEAAARLERAVRQDAGNLTARQGWTNALNVRMWVCADWVVPRRFWEIEDDQPADIGACIDPVLYWEQLLKLGEQESVPAMRIRLLQDIGVAFLLRSEYFGWEAATNRKRRSNDDPSVARYIVLLGSAVGALFAVETAGLDWPALDKSYQRWDALVQRWAQFEIQQGYVAFTPELAGFARDLAWRKEGSDCLRVVLESGKTQDTCPTEMRQEVARLVEFVRASYVR